MILGYSLRCLIARVLQRLKLQDGRLYGWPGEVCRCCGRRNVTGFIVDDDIWMAVVGDELTVWCPQCFDVEAQCKGIRYEFREIFPVSWSDWENHNKRKTQ